MRPTSTSCETYSTSTSRMASTSRRARCQCAWPAFPEAWTAHLPERAKADRAQAARKLASPGLSEPGAGPGPQALADDSVTGALRTARSSRMGATVSDPMSVFTVLRLGSRACGRSQHPSFFNFGIYTLDRATLLLVHHDAIWIRPQRDLFEFGLLQPCT